MKRDIKKASLIFALIFTSCLGCFTGRAEAQNLPPLEDPIYDCLKAKFPELKLVPGDATKVYDPPSYRSFFYDSIKKVWIDAKTGECICPCPSGSAMPPVPPKINNPGPPPASPSTPKQNGTNPTPNFQIPLWFGIKFGLIPKWLKPEKPGKPRPAQTFGSPLDSCLFGTWRSEPVGANMLGVTGGAGIVVTFKSDGTQIIDYNGMQAFKGGHGETNIWSGVAEGHIETSKGIGTVKSVERSDVMHTFTGPTGETRTNSLRGGLGPAGLGNNRLDPSYQCNETQLSYKDPARTFVFKHYDKNNPPIEIAKPGDPGPNPEGLALPKVPEPLRKACEPEYSTALAEADAKGKDAAGKRKSAEAYRSSGMSTRKSAQEDRKLAEFAEGNLIRAISNGDKEAEAKIKQDIAKYKERAAFEEAHSEYDLQKAASTEQMARSLEQEAEAIQLEAVQDCLKKQGSN